MVVRQHDVDGLRYHINAAAEPVGFLHPDAPWRAVIARTVRHARRRARTAVGRTAVHAATGPCRTVQQYRGDPARGQSTGAGTVRRGGERYSGHQHDALGRRGVPSFTHPGHAGRVRWVGWPGGGTGERLAVGGHHFFGGRRGVLPFAHPGRAGRVKWVLLGRERFGERLVGGWMVDMDARCMSARLDLMRSLPVACASGER